MKNAPSLKQLHYFRTLAETGHYRKAAERMGISQPSLSQQIGNLEERLGLCLVERGRNGAVLTSAGREVLHRARAILREVAALQDISIEMKAGMAGTIRLGASPTLGPYLLPQVVQEVRRRYPDLRLMIRDGAPADLLADLLAGQHDVILTQLPVNSSDVTIARLMREPLHLAVALDHPLAGRSRVADADLAGENVLALSDRFTLHGQVAALVRDIGAELRQDYEGTSLDTLRQMTAMNMGVTFLPALYARSEIPDPGGDVALVPYRRGRLTRSIGLAWRKTSGTHAAFETFARVIRSVLREAFAGEVSVET